MADVVICYARDGEATAGRLAGALAATGLSLWTEERSSAPIADRIDEVRAAVVIWSEAARASEWTRAEANYARGQKKLVQASSDGDPPPMPFDPRATSSLAGWSGEPDHPGWRKVRAEVEALVRPVRPAAAPAAPAPARRRVSSPHRRRRGAVPMALALIAVAAVLAAFFWVRSGPPFDRQPAPIALPKAAKQPPIPELPPLAPAPPLVQTGNEAALAAEQEPAEPATGAETEAARAETRPAPRPTGPRINRRNSENMRLFCQGAGRGTPQCRTFQRQLRNQQR